MAWLSKNYKKMIFQCFGGIFGDFNRAKKTRCYKLQGIFEKFTVAPENPENSLFVDIVASNSRLR
jgi:hypothetical protein